MVENALIREKIGFDVIFEFFIYQEIIGVLPEGRDHSGAETSSRLSQRTSGSGIETISSLIRMDDRSSNIPVSVGQVRTQRIEGCDRLASRHNIQLDDLVSAFPDTQAVGIIAFSIPWTQCNCSLQFQAWTN